MRVSGALRLCDTEKRTVEHFNILISDNAEVFRRYFGVEIFPGSLNVDIADPPSLQERKCGVHLTRDNRASSAAAGSQASMFAAGRGAAAKKPNAGATAARSWR